MSKGVNEKLIAKLKEMGDRETLDEYLHNIDRKLLFRFIIRMGISPYKYIHDIDKVIYALSDRIMQYQPAGIPGNNSNPDVEPEV